MTTTVIYGMHGLGDNLHTRAVVRALLQRGEDVYLKCPWYHLYHDLIGPRLHMVAEKTSLRIQGANLAREAEFFMHEDQIPHCDKSVNFHYGWDSINTHPSRTILQQMMACAGVADMYDSADYRLPIPEEWQTGGYLGRVNVRELVASWRATKPLMIYRPLTARSDWRDVAKRNAQIRFYHTTLGAIRHRYFVVSLASISTGKEWLLADINADVKLYADGAFVFESLAALFSHAALVFTSSGFAAILGPALGIPTISVAREQTSWHQAGAKFAPMWALDTRQPRPTHLIQQAVSDFCDRLGHPNPEPRAFRPELKLSRGATLRRGVRRQPRRWRENHARNSWGSRIKA
jgi:hypothetical protein